MSRYEALMLWTGTAVIAAWGGFSLFLSRVDPGRAGLGLAVLGFVLVIGALVAAHQALTRRQRGPLPDKRETAIDLRAEQLGYRALEAGCFLVILGVILERLTGAEEVVAALVTAIAGAALARAWGAVWLARRA